MNTKRKLRKDERAVSPVIGVILMVAITVIMAAIIGAFVYGYSGSMTQLKDVAATARHQGDTIYVTYVGGPDQDLVLSLTCAINTVTVTGLTSVVGSSIVDDTNEVPGQNNHVVVVAVFNDGSEQVILDTFC